MSTTNQIKTLPDVATIADQFSLAPIPRLLLRPAEAAHALGISSRLLWSLTRDGTIPVIRLRGTVRYSPTALRELIDGWSNKGE